MTAAIAAYYAEQIPVSGTEQDASDVAAGKGLYQQGVPDKVLPCMACHGADGEGAGMTPRLAGQHRAALERQLTYFATNQRTGGLMPDESAQLTERQMTDVSAYLANRSAAKPGTAARTGPGQVADTARVCSACHEFGDANVVPVFTFPRLAGQQQDYLVAQLNAFRDKTRADPRARAFMWDRAASLDNPMIERLAAHYAAQTPLPGFAQEAGDVAAGKGLYQQGVPDTVLPCMACHGTEGEGASIAPRLAGQHPLSLVRELSYFATNQRTGGLMPEESAHLTERQMTDVSAYLANRSAAKPGTAARTGPGQVADTARVCSACHEFGDANVVPVFTFPRLAGQQKDYLVAQIKAFRDKSRADPRARADMWDRAAHLSDAMIDGLAAYYAAQNPLPGFAQGAGDVAAGKRLYQQGVPDKVLACMACHGAEGQGTGIAPRLAGQHRLSLERQLGYFATNQRSGGLMPEEATQLTERQMTDVSAYLAARSEGKPSTAARTGPVTPEQVADTARVCSTCHEFGGVNGLPVFTFPLLAGQQKDYLVTQLKAFRDKSRADPRSRAFMWDRAAPLSDAMIEALAGHFSAEPPVAGNPASSPEIAAGAKIFAAGIPTQNAPACAGCHGDKGQGKGPIPRLAGQHRLALERQLGYFASTARASAIMHQQTNGLTPEQMKAVSAFLATQ